MLSVRRGLATLMVVAWASSAALAADSDALKPGMVLDQSNWQLAEGLLPPEILAHYKDGGYSNPIVDWPLGTFNWPPEFKAATEKNAGQYKISETGTVVLNSTGEQPPFILGQPFPIIDAKDPQAGAKILWNFFYLTWYYGNLHAESQVNWVGPKAIERRTDQDVNFMYYDGVNENDRVPNPQNFVDPAARRRQDPGRPRRHRGAQLALPRSGQARLRLGLRPCPAPRSRRQPGQPFRRLPRLGHESGRRPLLRREAGGLHLDVEG